MNDLLKQDPRPVVRKELYTAYCALLQRLRAWGRYGVTLEDLCLGTGLTPQHLQRPLFFLAAHGWVRVLTDDVGEVFWVGLTPRGEAHKALRS